MSGKVCLKCKGKTLLGVANNLFVFKCLKTSPCNVLPTLQSLTGSLQGRITYREIPVVITGNRYAEYNFWLFWLHNFPALITLKL